LSAWQSPAEDLPAEGGLIVPDNGIPRHAFIQDEEDLYAGEDVFMIGRFVDFDGGLANKPALRFGAISMFNAKIKQETEYIGYSTILDMRSRSGFSGSPVFAYRNNGMISRQITMGATNPRSDLRPRNWGSGTDTIVKIIGFHWGQFPEPWELKFKEANSSPRSIEGESYIEGMSGMTCIVPSKDVLRVMSMSEITKQLHAIASNLDSFPVAEC
jgi:hypothetical protein